MRKQLKVLTCKINGLALGAVLHCSCSTALTQGVSRSEVWGSCCWHQVATNWLTGCVPTFAALTQFTAVGQKGSFGPWQQLCFEFKDIFSNYPLKMTHQLCSHWLKGRYSESRIGWSIGPEHLKLSYAVFWASINNLILKIYPKLQESSFYFLRCSFCRLRV